MAKRRGKMCEPEEIIDKAEQDKLPHLQPKQLAFVLGICDGLSAYEAYCQAYDTQGGNAARVHATQLLKNDKIASWLDIAHELALVQGAKSIEGHWAELARLKELALRAGNYGAAVNAEVNRGKSQGHYVEQHRDMTERDDEGLLDRVQALFGEDFKRELAEKLGLGGTKH